MKAYLCNEFPDLFVHNRRIVLGDCAAPYRRYLDFYTFLGKYLVVIEVDEKQHNTTKYRDDEEARIHEIHNNIGVDKKMVFIRFNPSSYRIGGKIKRTSYETRLIKLKETVQEVLTFLEQGNEYEDVHTEIKLFFNA